MSRSEGADWLDSARGLGHHHTNLSACPSHRLDSPLHTGKTRTWKMIGQYRCTEIKKGLKMRVLKLTVKPPVLVLDVTVPHTRSFRWFAWSRIVAFPSLLFRPFVFRVFCGRWLSGGICRGLQEIILTFSTGGSSDVEDMRKFTRSSLSGTALTDY